MFRKISRATLSTIKHTILLGIAFTMVAGGVFLVWASTLTIPDFASIEYRKVAQSTKIYDRTGEVLLYDIHQDIKRTIVPHQEISPFIKSAAVAIEDAAFYEHYGVRPLAFLRAVLVNISEGEFSQGGSTITQQVVKNTLLTPEKKISRKLKEWVVAIKLEQEYSKEEILTLYLNESPYGGNIYGIEEASHAFFATSSLNVTLAQAAYLAALPQAPTYYSPYGNNRDALDERKNKVLRNMYSLNFITKEEYEEALAEVVEFQARDDFGIKAPHFVTWVREELVRLFGEEAIEESGFRVITTLDYELQEKAEEIVRRYAEENEFKFNANNAGMIGIDPITGGVLVMVGSRDYFDIEKQGNFNVTLARRQPGSAFKPFVYATAFERGYTPSTIVYDLQTQFQTTCDAEGEPLDPAGDPDECYTPRNYDNLFRGPITLRDALAQSVNVPAIKTLYLAGLPQSLRTAEKMGVTSLEDVGRYGLTLVLGGGEVSLLEMTSAYGVFANMGLRVPHQNILRIEDSLGNIVYEPRLEYEQVIPKNVSLQISDVLSDNEARTPAFGSQSYLYFPNNDVAVKTGTTNDYRDAWIIGYTPNFSLGTWVGNNDNTSMEKKVAGFIVAPMWNEMMQEILAYYPQEEFDEPESTLDEDSKPVLRGVWQGGQTYYVDAISGKLATSLTPDIYREERILMQIHNILHWVDKSNPQGPAPINPEVDAQYELWEEPVRKWVEIGGFQTQTATSIPSEYDDVHTEENKPNIAIIQFSPIPVIDKSTPVTIQVAVGGVYPISSVEYYVNDISIGSTSNEPYSFTFIPEKIRVVSGTNTLRAEVVDGVGNRGRTIQLFNIHN